LRKVNGYMQMKLRKILTVVFALAVMCGFSACNDKKTAQDGELNKRKPGIIDQDLIIDTRDITRNALFYPVEIEGKQMEVIAVKTPDGKIRTAFNACQVCYKLGKGYYVQVDTVLVCQRCKKRYRMEVIETKTGGCNPISIFPENKTETDSTITISKEYLAQIRAMFISWDENK
jgi:uncharacterized membrane protein